MHYFAYGSNMSTARLCSRIPSAVRVGVGRLFGYRLAFHKAGERDGSAKCDAFLTGDPDHEVLGVVYRLQPDEKGVLDAIEGVGHGYENRLVELTMMDGSRISAWVYCATAIDRALKPFDWYREHVVRGALENRLPGEYIALIEAVEAVPDPDPRRAERELSIYRRT